MSIFAAIAVGAVQALVEAQAKEQQWQEHLKGLSPEEKLLAIERRKQLQREQTEERRHQDLCSAIRNSKPSGIGIFW